MIHRGLNTIHSRDRGAISVLVLFTVIALVALLALVWNTGAYTTQREHVQLAADTYAHSSATLIARATNLIAAQNILICQYASAEVIWRSVRQINNFPRNPNQPVAWAQLDFDPDNPPLPKTFADSLRDRLLREQQVANAMAAGRNADLQAAKTAIQNALNAVNTQYKAANDAYLKVAGLTGAKYPMTQAEIQNFNNSLAVARYMLEWTNSAYVNGTSVQVTVNPPMVPGPGPGPNGESLTTIANITMEKLPDKLWVSGIVNDHILPAIKDEMDMVVAFEARVAPAQSQNVPANMAYQQATAFHNESTTANLLFAPAMQDNYSELETGYNCKLGLAARSDPTNPDSPTPAPAPVVAAGDVPFVINHFDTLRQTNVVIDPVNSEALSPAGDARIRHDDVLGHVPELTRINNGFLTPTHTIDGWESNDHLGWGHVYAAPLQRYFNARVWGDASGLALQLQGIDTRRDQLSKEIAAVVPPIAPLPQFIRLSFFSPVPNTPPTYLDLPFAASFDYSNIPTPYINDAALLAVFRDQLNAYINAVNNLRNLILQITSPFAEFTWAFAVYAWQTDVDFWRNYKLRVLGEQKQFMVLAPYALRNVPVWALTDMQNNAREYIQAAIIQRHLPALVSAISMEFSIADPGNIRSIIPNQFRRANFYAEVGAYGVRDIARAVATDAANQMAPELAAEWATRPWPYEITPPENPIVPADSPPGMGDVDRQHHFTVIAAAFNDPQVDSHLIMPAVMVQMTAPMIAYAQAEIFNWMEFNSEYGGNDHYSTVNFLAPIPPPYLDLPLPLFTASPPCWRLCSEGGWNWQPRLAYSFDLSRTLRVNEPFANMFKEAGAKNVTGNLDPIILH